MRYPPTTILPSDPPVSSGLLDTCVVIGQEQYDANELPREFSISSITMAELSFGLTVAGTPLEVAVRAQRYANMKAWIKALPFDAVAADRYGELCALLVGIGRSLRPRRLDLMIAATAVVHRLSLYTSNPDDFRGLESVLTVVPVYPMLPSR